MSFLDTVVRPFEIFDPARKQHREWFTDFQKTHRWSHCPVRFAVNEEGEQVPIIQRQLLEFYMAREFSKN
jgi:hypothetical protein